MRCLVAPWFTAGLVSLVALAVQAGEAADVANLRVAEGFRVSRYAGDDLATNIYTITCDSQGRIVVSGPGYIKALVDADGDGTAEAAETLSTRPETGAQGMYFDGDDLIFVGDGALVRMQDADGDGKFDDPIDVWARLRGGEHGAHAIRRAADGSFYVICGNSSGIDAELISSPHSSIRDPRAGGILRMDADGKNVEVVAHGFRNAFDMALNAEGHLFTVDSDGERVHHLPWYTPTRLFDVSLGWQHGWLGQGTRLSWSRPEAFFDNTPRLAEIGRGSPTGIVCYRHDQFPQRYRNGLFAACWTFGRIDFFPLTPSGATYRTKREVFLETTGTAGFAPVDLVVAPEGDVYVAVGGRHTRGGVYRISYEHPAENSVPDDVLAQVLDAPQPLASWSRARWRPLAEAAGREAFVGAAADTNRALEQRRRAIEILVECFGSLTAEELSAFSADKEPVVRAAAAWAAASAQVPDAWVVNLCRLTRDENVRVQRAAWEGLLRCSIIPHSASLAPDWVTAEANGSRRIRTLMTAVARGVGRDSFLNHLAVRPKTTERGRLTRLWARPGGLEGSDDERRESIAICLAAFHKSDDLDVRRDAVRLLEIAVGGIATNLDSTPGLVGYEITSQRNVPARDRDSIVESLAAEFPSGDAVLDRELTRLMAMLAADDAGLTSAVAGKWSAESTVEDDVHYLMVMARLSGKRKTDETRATADALCRLHAKLAATGGYVSRHWPERVGTTFRQLQRRDNALGEAVVDNEEFGRAEHSLFVAALDEPLRGRAARRMLERLSRADVADEGWTAAAVRSMKGVDQRQLYPALRARFDAPPLADAIVLVLAQDPQREDRERFVRALASLDGDAVEAAATALATLATGGSADEISRAIASLARQCAVVQGARAGEGRQWQATAAVRAALVDLLADWAERPFVENSDAAYGTDRYRSVFDWFDATHPELAAARAGSTDVSSWTSRLADVEWQRGDAQSGVGVFAKFSCQKCHAGAGLLGPSLVGAAARMSPGDLFAAVVDPSRDVAAAYRTTQVMTTDGQIYHGVPIYESPESTLLQTGPDETVRIRGEEIESIETSGQSLMPTGLLDQATDQDLADLYAYLQTLAGN